MSRRVEREVAVGFVVDRMSQLYNGFSLGREDLARNTVGKDRTLRDRITNGMVDDTFRDENGEPLLARLPDGTVVPNGAASDEKSLTKAREALMAPRRWPVAK